MPPILWPLMAWYMLMAALTGRRRERKERET